MSEQAQKIPDIDFLDESTDPKNNSYYELKRVKQIHHEIAMLGLLGYNHKQIANKLDVSRTMVDYTLGSEIVQKKMKILRKERDKQAVNVAERIKELQPLALDELEQLLVDPNTSENNKRMIAQDLLDRGGNQAVDLRADISDQMTTKDINEIKERARNGGFMVEAEEADYEEMEEGSEEPQEQKEESQE